VAAGAVISSLFPAAAAGVVAKAPASGGSGKRRASASSSSAAAAAAAGAAALFPPRRTGCLPCLRADCAAHKASGVREDGDAYCAICYTEGLAAAPCIRLSGCGHVLHAHCVLAKLAARWAGTRITFTFMACPLCSGPMEHWSLAGVLAPLRALRATVEQQARQRLRLEGLEKAPEIVQAGGRHFGDPAGYAMDRFAFTLCDVCGKPYFAGMRACGAAVDGAGAAAAVAPPAGGAGAGAAPRAGAAEHRLLCSACKPPLPGIAACPKHGTAHLLFKCKFCCKPSSWFCWNTTHFCHEHHTEWVKKPGCCVAQPCPGKDKCPLGIVHENGKELSLGCEACKLADVEY
jgi:E3 ubiquitin-protein ligase MYCBP2